jgi:hypothetical protein
MRLRRILPLALACLWAPAVHTWGVEGHHIVARIALSRLTPEAKGAVQALLGADDFVSASTWADEVRSRRPETYNWHFVDIPVDAISYDAVRDCKPSSRGDCIIAELERARRGIADTSLSAEARKEALKFLIHFVGDLHQPLHATDNQDRGGNDVHVTLAGAAARGSVNLHSVWDTTLISARGLGDAAYADLLIADLKAHPVEGGPIDFVRWAEQAHEVGVQVTYAYPGFSPTGPPKEAIALDDPYLKKAEPTIDRQLTVAGVRLALVLNEAFVGGGGSSGVQPLRIAEVTVSGRVLPLVVGESAQLVVGTRRVVYGHIHRAYVRRLPSFTLANSGSVSLPYDGDPRSAYVLVDDDQITIRRVEYDIEREVTTLFEIPYPYAAWLADMLRKGTYVPPPD